VGEKLLGRSRILQNYINNNLRFMVGGCGMDCCGSGLGQIAGCELGNEPSGSIKCREILDHLRKEYFLNKVCIEWS
jgi:hypothetical protein